MCVSFFFLFCLHFSCAWKLYLGGWDDCSFRKQPIRKLEGGLASFFSSFRTNSKKQKGKERSKRRRLPAVSRFYRAHRMSPPLGAAWVSDKRESRGLSEEEEDSTSLLSSSLKVRALASRHSFVRAKREKTTLFDEGQWENLCILPKSRERRKSRSSRRYIIVSCLLFSRVFLLGSRKNACRESGVEK